MQSVTLHFSQIAKRYREVRTTDLEPIVWIADQLPKTRLRGADVGCGAGRYDLSLLRHIPKLSLICIDQNTHMLAELQGLMRKNRLRRFKAIESDAERLPVRSNSLDCLFSFNAIHHFNIKEFMGEASRILKPGGRLFIYTRLRSQNARTIWGTHFPGFAQKETRLYELPELLDQGQGMLRAETVKFFFFPRAASLERLCEQAKHHHYSTFKLFTPAQFDEALASFTEALRGTRTVRWTDENVLVVLRRIPSGQSHIL